MKQPRSEVEQEMETGEEQCSGFDIDYDRWVRCSKMEGAGTQNPLTEKDLEIGVGLSCNGSLVEKN